MSDTSNTTTSQTFWAWLTGELDAGWAFLQNLFKSLVSSEVSALAPFAEQAIADLEGGVSSLFTGGLSGFATAIAPVLFTTAQKAEAAGVQAAGQSLVAAVGGAISNAQAAQPVDPSAPADTASQADSAAQNTNG